MFGFKLGLLIAWAGNVLGGIVAFKLGRSIHRSRTPRTVPQKALQWVDAHIRGGDWRVALVIRFIPMFPISVFNFALGRTNVSFWTFLWTTAVGVVPMSAVLVAFGYGATGGRNLLPWAAGALGAMLVFGIVYRFRIGRGAQSGRSSSVPDG